MSLEDLIDLRHSYLLEFPTNDQNTITDIVDKNHEYLKAYNTFKQKFLQQQQEKDHKHRYLWEICCNDRELYQFKDPHRCSHMSLDLEITLKFDHDFKIG